MLVSLAVSVALRLALAASTRTFSQPDEYYQSLEIAHLRAFGYGYETWEWRPDIALRSPLYPLMFERLYRWLDSNGLDDKYLVLAPKLLQGSLAALCDVATARLASVLLGRQFAWPALVLSWTSFYHAFALSRTFSNSIETILTACALSIWPWHFLEARKDRHFSSITLALLLAALATIMRPPSGVLWFTLFADLIIRQNALATRFAAIAGAVAGGAYALCILVDSGFYRQLTITPLRFFVFNLYEGVSLFYGVNHAMFYVTQALPAMLVTQLVFVAKGLFGPRGGALRSVVASASAVLVVLSLLPHKEVRFLHPILPVLHVIGAKALGPTVRRRTVAILAFTGLLPALYLNLAHCKGQVEIMHYLRQTGSSIRSVGFLMPCHSTPWMSHLHVPRLADRSWFITCEPPIRGQNKTTYLDESDFFYRDPASFLRERFPSRVDPAFPANPVQRNLVDLPDDHDLGWRHEWPSHVVMFEALVGDEAVSSILDRLGYRAIHRIWNSHWHDDRRRRGDILVYVHRDAS